MTEIDFKPWWVERTYRFGANVPTVADPYSNRVMRPDEMMIRISSEGRILSVQTRGPLIRKTDGADGSWVTLLLGRENMPAWVYDVLNADGVTVSP